jgi:hypothetical protein
VNQNQKKCLVEGCMNYAHARGLCRKHCGRFYRGAPLEDVDGPVIGRIASTKMSSEFSLKHQLDSMEMELKDVVNRSNLVIGVDNRIRLARQRRELQARIEHTRSDLMALRAEDAEVVAVVVPAEDVVCAVMVG